MASLEDRFWKKVDVQIQGCWNWQAASHPQGYGHMWIEGKTFRQAHRISYEIHYGKIPDGYVIDHLCHNRSCVRPDHLKAVTPQDNWYSQ